MQRWWRHRHRIHERTENVYTVEMRRRLRAQLILAGWFLSLCRYAAFVLITVLLLPSLLPLLWRRSRLSFRAPVAVWKAAHCSFGLYMFLFFWLASSSYLHIHRSIVASRHHHPFLSHRVLWLICLAHLKDPMGSGALACCSLFFSLKPLPYGTSSLG